MQLGKMTEGFLFHVAYRPETPLGQGFLGPSPYGYLTVLPHLKRVADLLLCLHLERQGTDLGLQAT